MDDLRSTREAQKLEQKLHLLEGAMPTPLDWVSAYATILDRLRGEPYSASVTSPYDRKFGRNFPLYNSESELSLLRAPSRVLCQTNTYAQGLVEGLTSYVIGTGFTYRVTPRKGRKPPPGLVEVLQWTCDQFIRRNNWHNAEDWQDLDVLPQQSIEEEFFARSLRDGESTLVHYDQDGLTTVRFAEPEFIVQPPGSRWQEWSFGWRTPEDDEQKKIAAWISWTGNPVDGSEVPVQQLSSLKRNGDRILKRGVPDFAFDAYDAISTSQKLRRALAVGGAQKASIVGVRQHKGQTQGQVQDFSNSLADFTTVDMVTGNQQNVRQYSPGEWEDVPENLEYAPGPSTANEAALVEVLQACLRGAVVRWNGFEWLISADASSNSYANALAAQSPAVLRVRREQGMYKGAFTRSITIAIKNAADAGRIRAGGYTFTWDEIKRLTDLQVEAPDPETRDPLQETQANAARVQTGWKSRQTIMQEEGLDVEREIANMDEWRERFGPDGPPLELPPDQPPAEGGPTQEGRPFQESKDESGHEHAADGKFGSGGSGGGRKKPTKKTAAKTEPAKTEPPVSHADREVLRDKLADYEGSRGAMPDPDYSGPRPSVRDRAALERDLVAEVSRSQKYVGLDNGDLFRTAQKGHPELTREDFHKTLVGLHDQDKLKLSRGARAVADFKEPEHVIMYQGGIHGAVEP